MVVVAIQSKEEGNVAAGMIEALKKCMEIWSWYVQMTWQLWTPKQFNTI